ncbi:hypothetical protein ABZ883_05145 [Streptomyces sp. NPDC046977]|uniref:hypothetical protein n=1 Tax=Streptomyces sp. NPDC046977 TaxID=3154703 RepID=UPI0033C0AA84
MSRWVVNRLTALSMRMRARVRAGGDAGQTSFEYLGIAVVIAVIIGVLATTDIGNAVRTGILDKIADIVGGG